MFLRFVFLIVFAFSFLTGRAQAEEYIAPSWPDLVHTMIRMNAIDMADLLLLDEYGLVTECDLYEVFYKDDFKWNKVRKAMRQSIRMNLASYPLNYRYDLKMQLDRYDFTTRLFRFTEKTMPQNVNTFLLYSAQQTPCNKDKLDNIPLGFRAVLTAPLFLEGLPLPEKEAKALLVRMEKNENVDRIVYARYNLRTIHIEPMHKTIRPYGQAPHYEQLIEKDSTMVRFDMQLDSINFYEDPQMTKLIYKFQQ